MIDELRKRERPFTGRGLARFLGTSADYVIAEIRGGKPEPLRAYRRGSWYMIDPRDVAEWLETKRVKPTSDVEDRVRRVLAREAEREGAP